jgi:BlaI family transcriptional regulator, penicillinase repressor
VSTTATNERNKHARYCLGRICGRILTSYYSGSRFYYTMRIQLTKFELEIMDVLWRLEEASVREVMDALSETKRPAYTTVQTIVQRLEQKGAVRRTRKIGNALMFEPAVTKTSAYRRVIDELLALFGGSAQPVVAHLLESGKLTLEDLKALEEAESAKQPAAPASPAAPAKKGGRK